MLLSQAPRVERRGSGRRPVSRPALLRAGELVLRGEIQDVSGGGAFLGTQLLIEVGERGVLEVGGASIAVEVVWLRGAAHAHGPGMGLIFGGDAAERERFVQML